jgi:hypothetical protein
MHSKPSGICMMDEEFKDFIDRGIVFIYMDDIVIATEGPLFVHI